MPDEAAPADPRPQPKTKAEKVAWCRDLLDQGYSTAQVRELACRKGPGKDWATSPRCAREYLDLALEQVDAEVAQPKDRKQARTRGMLTLFARRALELAQDGKLTAKAAGLINAGVAALDKIARIDGSYAYDASSNMPSSVNVVTAEEAVRIVAHAQATIDMAMRRGALAAPAGPPPPPVIDVAENEPDPDESEQDMPDDAN